MCQRVAIAGFNQIAVDAITNLFRNAANIAADHRATKSHGFEHRHRAVFIIFGGDDHRAGPTDEVIQLLTVFHVAEELWPTETRAQIFAQWAVADNLQRHHLLHFLLCLRQRRHAFFPTQATNIEKIVARGFAGYGAVGINTVDDYLNAGIGQLTQQCLAHKLARGNDAVEHGVIFGELLPVGLQRQQQAFEGVALLTAVTKSVDHRPGKALFTDMTIAQHGVRRTDDFVIVGGEYRFAAKTFRHADNGRRKLVIDIMKMHNVRSLSQQ